MASTEMSLYRASMQRIIQYAGLAKYEEFSLTSPPQYMPLHSANMFDGGFRCGRLETHADGNEREVISQFFETENSVVWREYLKSLPESHRYEASARHRLCTQLWFAHSKKRCLYCWVPRAHCICHELDAQRAKIQQVMPRAARATMVMHVEEVMRCSNSGHIAAYILDAPVCIWGIPAQSEYLLNLTATEKRSSVDVGVDAGSSVESLNVLLYPVANATPIEDFVRSTMMAASGGDGGGAGSETGARSVHIFALDGTWNQAVALNRHISPSVPRVVLNIAPDYESLFLALRKRTRSTGVSTLEALGMAMEQCVSGMGLPDDAQHLTSLLRDTMKIFVDRQCVLKHRKPQFGTIPVPAGHASS